MRLLLIDNHDSFTWNLVHYFEVLGAEVEVVACDAVGVGDVAARCPEALAISPGPGRPEDSGITVDVVAQLSDRIPTLGVCLGHQAIGVATGGALVRAVTPVHGKTSWVHHRGTGLFGGLPSPFRATRYHSLVLDRERMPGGISVDAWTDDGTIMAIRHEERPLWGVQFHPESFATEHGHALLANFLESATRWNRLHHAA